MFKDLINDLKQVKQPEQITEELADELTIQAINAHMSVYLQESEILPHDAFDMARMSILKAFDEIFLDLNDIPMDFEYEDIPKLAGSPMGDDILRKQLEKAFEDYNKRMGTKVNN